LRLEECVIEEHIIEDEDQDEDQNDIPSVGMRFSSHEEAYNFYNKYALRVGFSVRRGGQTISKQGVSSKRFVCNKEGRGKREKNKRCQLGV
jgi:zinc finger SWIM domain-containing protein 3